VSSRDSINPRPKICRGDAEGEVAIGKLCGKIQAGATLQLGLKRIADVALWWYTARVRRHRGLPRASRLKTHFADGDQNCSSKAEQRYAVRSGAGTSSNDGFCR